MQGGGKPELRLGLVLYGGVSLAVYIYGAVLEVQRLLDASAELSERGAGEEGEGLSAYAEALRDAGISGAVVDVIAGTSAGGINGILLAKALAAGASVSEVRDLWIKGGDIGTLLNRRDCEDPASLLSTEEFERRLRDGFQRLDDRGAGPDPDVALDLFVSATHLRGDRREFMDTLGRSIESLVHRFVVHLKQRRYGRNDFRDPDGRKTANEQLVELARATSAFPVAFQPELLEGEKLLGPHAEPSGWFSDGGILNNKPFTEALRTIFTRSSPEGPVRRWLLSLDPDPKPIPRKAAPGPEPAFDQILGAALVGVPRYQSIASDLEDLESHNASVKRVAQVILDLETGIARTGDTRLGPAVEGAYRRLRRRALAQQIAESLLDVTRPADPASFDPDATLAAFVEGALEAISEYRRDEAADLAFQRRRVYYLIKLLGMSLGPAEEDREAFAAARAGLWDAFEGISQSLWQALGLDEGLRLGGDGDPRDEAFAAARGRTAEALGAMRSVGADVDGGLRASLGPVTVRLPSGEDGEAPFVVSLGAVFDGFAARDFLLLSVEAGGGVRFREVVSHAQISPDSAGWTKVASKMKLAGDTAGHFGGFLDERWRRNDLRWGRLDAAEILMRVVLAEQPVQRREEGMEAVCREILEEECPAALEAPDWRAYLATDAIGDAELGDLAPSQRRGLSYRGAVVLRRMLSRARVGAERSAPAHNLRVRALRGIDGALRKLLRFLAVPRWFYERRWRKDAEKTEKPSS